MHDFVLEKLWFAIGGPKTYLEERAFAATPVRVLAENRFLHFGRFDQHPKNMGLCFSIAPSGRDVLLIEAALPG